MQLKDYYGILQIEISATKPEIKKAYRKLAMQFHPDKNQDDLYAAARFEEIKEAYEVLTNPSKKEYYLQQRWYNQSIGKRKTESIITPVTVLKQMLELDIYVYKLDVHRMDKQGLADYTGELLSNANIDKILLFNEQHVNNQIIIIAIKAMSSLTYRQAEVISNNLYKLAGENAEFKKMINEFLYLKKQKEKTEKYKPVIALLIVAILCLLIWMMGR
jgi:DnaJ domain